MKKFLYAFFFQRMPIMFFVYLAAAIGSIWVIKLVPLALMFFLCRWDAMGYFQILSRGYIGVDNRLHQISYPDTSLAAYRILDAETSYLVLILTFVLISITTGMRDAIFAISTYYISYLFGMKDVLYYIALGDSNGLSNYVFDKELNAYKKNNFSWMYWTPLGIIYFFINKKENKELNWIEYLDAVFIEHSPCVKNIIWVKWIKLQAVFGTLLSILIILFLW